MNMECRMNLGVHWRISSATRIISLLKTDYQKQKNYQTTKKIFAFLDGSFSGDQLNPSILVQQLKYVALAFGKRRVCKAGCRADVSVIKNYRLTNYAMRSH